MRLRVIGILLTALLAGCSAEEPQRVQQKAEQSKPLEHPVQVKPSKTVENSNAVMEEEAGIHPSVLSIPALDLEAPVKEFGLDEEGNMELPENGEDVAWFEPGSEPGDAGNAVLAGHVDDEKAPAIFFRLKELEIGDEIYLYDKNGERLTFVVRDKVAYQKDDAPLRKIFGPTDKRMLNLITCTGYFDRDIRNYVERLVVYTELTEEPNES
ncbi:class F sortase [Bacillus sp. Marseille-Q1617]|uniref:class F sortase n=1 Tax=Bacillus sp. Marseille-Q1617 TaxID=2736887 RepID=UPI00158C0E0F|nr:class F sortase [Bacillus sp. Marseille-Q1617]